MRWSAGGSQVCNPLPGRLRRPNSPECTRAVGKLLNLLEWLGFLVVVEKREGPATTLEFLGFEVDSGAMEVRLPARKLAELNSLLRQWQGRKVARRRELDSLVGKLVHASQVMQPGKTFMRRLFELQKGFRKPYHQIKLGRSPVGPPMVVDLHRGVKWREHHPSGQQYLTRVACVDRRVRPVWLWGSGSGDKGLVAAAVAQVIQPGAPT